MDWKKFLNELLAAKNKFMADANTALKPLPPIEQHEASSVVGFAIRELNNCFQWITTTCMRLDSDLQELITRGEQIIADCNKAYVESEVTAGNLIPKAKIEAGDYLTKEVAQANCNAAAEAAANARETEVVDRLKLLASRRSELSTPSVADGKEVPALLSREIADKLSDEMLRADDWKEKAGVIAARLKEVNDLGVSIPELLTRAAELPLDDAGNTAFKEQLSMIKTAVGEKPGGKRVITAPLASGPGKATGTSDYEGCF